MYVISAFLQMPVSTPFLQDSLLWLRLNTKSLLRTNHLYKTRDTCSDYELNVLPTAHIFSLRFWVNFTELFLWELWAKYWIGICRSTHIHILLSRQQLTATMSKMKVPNSLLQYPRVHSLNCSLILCSALLCSSCECRRILRPRWYPPITQYVLRQ